MTEPKHPRQVTYTDQNGVQRFQPNEVIRWLFETDRISLNEISRQRFPDEDMRQLAQLLGYSVSGYHDLSYTEDEGGEFDPPWPHRCEAVDSAKWFGAENEWLRTRLATLEAENAALTRQLARARSAPVRELAGEYLCKCGHSDRCHSAGHGVCRQRRSALMPCTCIEFVHLMESDPGVAAPSPPSVTPEQGDICPASKRYPCDPVCERCGRAMDYSAVPGPDRALELMRELVAGVDDYRCWYVPEEILTRARALVEEGL